MDVIAGAAGRATGRRDGADLQEEGEGGLGGSPRRERSEPCDPSKGVESGLDVGNGDVAASAEGGLLHGALRKYVDGTRTGMAVGWSALSSRATFSAPPLHES